MICDIITDHIGSLNHYVLTTTDSRIRAERYYKTKYLTPPVDQILIDKFQLVSAVPIHHVADSKHLSCYDITPSTILLYCSQISTSMPLPPRHIVGI